MSVLASDPASCNKLLTLTRKNESFSNSPKHIYWNVNLLGQNFPTLQTSHTFVHTRLKTQWSRWQTERFICCVCLVDVECCGRNHRTTVRGSYSAYRFICKIAFIMLFVETCLWQFQFMPNIRNEKPIIGLRIWLAYFLVFLKVILYHCDIGADRIKRSEIIHLCVIFEWDVGEYA